MKNRLHGDKGGRRECLYLKWMLIVTWTRVVAMEVIRVRLPQIIRLWLYFEERVESIYCWLYVVIRKRKNSVTPPVF